MCARSLYSVGGVLEVQEANTGATVHASIRVSVRWVNLGTSGLQTLVPIDFQATPSRLFGNDLLKMVGINVLAII